MLDFVETYERLRSGVVGLERACDVVTVTGPDAFSYLQGQCTQDLAALGVSETTETLFLSPQGKFELWARIARVGEDSFVVEVLDGFGEQAYERLRRFKLRVKADLSQSRWQVVEVRGRDVAAPTVLPKGASYLAKVSWPGLFGFDLVGEDVALPTGIERGDPVAFDVARIEAGLPLLGVELVEKTIPQEAGIVERTVSFTKGCFTGQELVARVDARGSNVPRRLRGLMFPAGSSPRVGDEVLVEDRVVGTLTSVGDSPRLGAAVGLAYLRREVTFPAALVVRGPDGARETNVTAVELPLFSS